MKTLALTTALILAAAGAASATSINKLAPDVAFRVSLVAPNADLSALSVTQIGRIENLFNTTGEDRNDNNLAGEVLHILNNAS